MILQKTILASLLLPFLCLCRSLAQPGITEEDLSALEFRNFGAYRVGAWLSSIAVPENPGENGRHTFYVAARNGGVWKTENNGTTFRQIFDAYGVNTVGAVALAASDPDLVWVGTGDSYNTRSSYPGNGVYRSTDGGDTFQRMGLGDSHHIAKILVHPREPNTVYVAVMGHLYTTNAERGVLKTRDGGKTWQKVLFVSDRTGVIDLVMDPRNPDVLFAAAYEKHRYPWTLEAGGKESGIYKTVDGGTTWKRLAAGLPAGTIGRIGIDLCRRSPDVVYALFENLNPKDTVKELKTEGMMGSYRDSYYDQLKGGEMYRSDDCGRSWRMVSEPRFNLSSKAAYSFNIVAADPNDENRVYVLSAGLHISSDGGRTWSGFRGEEGERLFPRVFGDYRTFWIDPRDSRHIMLGSDGGLYRTFDGGKSVEHLYNIPVGEVYAVAADMQTPYHLYCGLQDHEAWRAPTNSWAGSITLEDWDLVGISDGMYCAPDTESGRWFYTTGQFGLHQRVDLLNGQRRSIMPTRGKGEPAYRFTWTTPLVISSHNSATLLTGAEVLLRSRDRGDHWEVLSPDLTTNDPARKNGRGHIQYCAVTTIAESPLRAGVIWVGTDDGKIQVTQDYGRRWDDRTPALELAGAPPRFWVTRVCASRQSPSVAYVTTSGYAFDDPRPAVFRTRDMGLTWENIASDLPREAVNVIWEDRKNGDLLFVGTDGGAYASLNGGRSWLRFRALPPVPVKDLLVHPREDDLIIGTFGRGCYVAFIGPLRNLAGSGVRNEATLFPVKSRPLRNYSEQVFWGNRELMGTMHLRTPNEPNGFEILYYLETDSLGSVNVQIRNASDSLLSDLKVPGGKGLHRQVWDFGNAREGEYRISLSVKGQVVSTRASILPALVWPLGGRGVGRQKTERPED